MVCIFRTRACTNGRFNINFRSISNDWSWNQGILYFNSFSSRFNVGLWS
jgi:hypothetical protein